MLSKIDWLFRLLPLALTLPLATRAQVNLTVNVAQPIRTVDERVFGVNAVIWDPQAGSAQTVSMVQNAGIRTIRVPGGSLSDEYHWRINKSLTNTWTWATAFNGFINLITSANTQAVVTVNYGSGTPEEAAGLVAYLNASVGSSAAIGGTDGTGFAMQDSGYWTALRAAAPLATDDGMNFLRISRSSPVGARYFEIGNECYGTWETDQQAVAHDPTTYANRVQQYIAKMKAVDPTIKIGVVVVTSSENGSYKNWTPTMLARLKTLNAIPDFIIYHLYPQAPGAESDAALLQVADTGSKSWPTIAADLRQQLTANLGPAAGAGVEIVVTENNSVYSSPGKQSTSLVNGLYLADSIGNLMQTEINGYMYWALRNSPPTINNGTALDGNMSASLYGWRQFGDYGMISTPSTLTGETTYYNPYPTYYMMKLLSHFARGGDTVVQAASSNPLLSIFAAKRTDGSLSLLVINKDPTNAQNASIGLNGFSPASTASTYICGKDQDTAAQTGVGSADIATGSISLSGPTFSASFFPYSASVVSLTATTTGTSPVISTQPVARSIGVGQAVAFSVTATGTPAPGYQWQRQTAGVGSWENVSEGGSFRGVSTGVLTIDAISAGMSGDQFRAVVTNASGSVITNAVALTVTGTSLLQYPVGVTVDFSGNIYVADSASNTIRKITTNGVVSTLAGAVGTSGSADGTGGTARFNHPGAIAVDLMGTLYVADTGNSIIRKISSDGIVTTLAGSVSSRGNQDGVGSSATFNSPEGIAVDVAGTIYVADTMNATIRAVTAGGTVSTVAGGVLLRGSQDGNGTVARFSFPSGISVDTAGNLYVSDTDNGTIRKIAADRSVTTLAGLPGVGGTTDGNGTNALFNQPSGLAVDSSAVIYVTDTGNSTIRKVTPTGTVSTFAGLPGISGLGNGSGINALFNQPRAIAINSSGVLFVADTGNAVIREIAANGNVTALALTEASKPDSGGGASIPPPATTPSVPPSPGSGSSSGGGGAIGECFVAALASLLAARFGLFVRCDR